MTLARYGGLRCPSEVLSLRWQDIDWDSGRIVVQSPKTEHHAGKASRTIPLFPELRPILAEAFDLAPEGAVFVVDERMRATGQSRLAGLQPANAIRADHQTGRPDAVAASVPQPCGESARQNWRGIPIARGLRLAGQQRRIARKHYLQVTDADFERAAEAQEKAAQKAATQRTECGAAGTRRERRRIAPIERQHLSSAPLLRFPANRNLYTENTGNTGVSDQSGAESRRTWRHGNALIDPGLVAVVRCLASAAGGNQGGHRGDGPGGAMNPH